MKLSTVLLLPLIFFFSIVYAQEKRNALPQIVPKSPDVAAMETYGDVPVSESFGTANVGIPLTSISVGKFTLPISLTYHKNGLKVDEVPSSVGDGWTLNYGGAVSFHQNGINDFGTFGMFEGGAPGAIGVLKKFFRGHMTPFERTNYIEQVISNQIDGEFDFFDYSFLGQQGVFYYDTLMKPTLIPKADLKIERINNEIVITDNQNNRYYFGDIEHANGYETSSVEYSYAFSDISAYYLSRIVTSENRNIKFKYKSYSYLIMRDKYIIEHSQLSSNPSCMTLGPGGYGYNEDVGVLLPDSIVFDEGAIKFILSTEGREDIKTVSSSSFVPYLKGFYLVNNGGGKIWEYSFTQGYFGGNKRLKLGGITEKNGTTTGRRWNFNYYNENFDFPTFTSYAKDHWGYYNGYANGSLIPEAKYDQFVYGWRNYSVQYANRNATFNSLYGMLKEIGYPTGGSTIFEYEPNQVKVSSYRQITDLTPFFSIPNSIYFDPLAGGNTGLTNGAISGSFVVPPAPDGGAPVVRIQGFVNYDPDHFEDPLYNFTGPSGPQGAVQLGTTLGANYSSVTNTSGTEITTTLMPGTYTYSLVPGRTWNAQTNSYFPQHLNFSVSIEKQSAPLPYLVGGVRVARIITSDSLGTPPKYRRYIYSDSLHQVEFRNIPFYMSQTDIGVAMATGSTFNCFQCGNRVTIFGDNVRTVAGSHIEYAKVIMYDSSSAGQLGKTESLYMLSTNEAGSYAEPYVAPINSSWRGGMLLNRKDYKYENGSMQIVKEVQNLYTETDRQNLTNGIRINYGYYCPVTNFSDRTYNISLSTLFTKQFNLQQTKEYFYLPTQSFVNETNYTISSLQHTLPTVASISDSKGGKLNEKTLYSFDYSNDNPISSAAKGIKKLKENNVLVPIEQITYRTVNNIDYVMGATLTTYKESVPLPDKIYKLNLAAPVAMGAYLQSNTTGGNFNMDSRYKLMYEFSSYDNNNQLTNAITFDRAQISYLYDYNNTYPVAEVINAQTSDIAYTSFEAEQKGSWAFSGVPVTDAMSPTGSRCYNLGSGTISRNAIQSTKTYIISYWTKNQTPLNISGTLAGYPIQGKVVNGWTFFMHKVKGVSSVSLLGSGFIDELRLYPEEARMKSYTYKLLTGVSAVCDESNIVVYYEYDALGRLQVIKDMDRNVLKVFEYKYR
jgi:hypothetical protein